MKLAELMPNQSVGSPKAAAFLAVVSDAGSREAVAKLISDQAIAHAHVETGTIDDAIRLVRQLQASPSLIIVDVSASPMPLSDLMRLAQVCDPSVRVIAIGNENDVGLFRNLLRIGVQDYLVKPLTLDLLRRSLASEEPVMQARAGKVVSFFGTRGGVGVTTIAVCLARYLANEGRRRVAYLDLNLRSSAANSLLGLTSNNGLAELLQMVQPIDAAFVERMLVAKGDRLFVLSAEVPYGEQTSVREGSLIDILDTLKRSFHYVLLDGSGCDSRFFDDAFDASNLVYVVADRSVHSAHECTRLIDFSESRTGERTTSVLLNNPLEPVPGRVDPADFDTAFGRSISHVLPYDPQALALAENLAEPAVEGKRKNFVQAVRQFAREITGDVTPMTTPWRSRLTRLWRRS